MALPALLLLAVTLAPSPDTADADSPQTIASNADLKDRDREEQFHDFGSQRRRGGGLLDAANPGRLMRNVRNMRNRANATNPESALDAAIEAFNNPEEATAEQTEEQTVVIPTVASQDEGGSDNTTNADSGQSTQAAGDGEGDGDNTGTSDTVVEDDPQALALPEAETPAALQSPVEPPLENDEGGAGTPPDEP